MGSYPAALLKEPCLNKGRFLRCLGALALATAAPLQADAQNPAARSTPSPTAPSASAYTPEVLNELRKVIPNGESLTERDIQERMDAAKPSASGKLIPPSTSAGPLDEEANRKLLSEVRGHELSSIKLVPLRAGKPAPNGRQSFEGTVLSLGDEAILLKETTQPTAAEVWLNFSSSPGFSLGPLTPPTGALTGAWGIVPTLAGDVHGTALRDGKGLWFATESRRSRRILYDADLQPFSLKQDPEHLGEPVRQSECLRVYLPDVLVSFGKGQSAVIAHGQKRVVTAGEVAYLIQIVRSQHNASAACSTDMEVAPWVLEYAVMRLDDPRQVARWQHETMKKELPGKAYPDDTPTLTPGADGPPDPLRAADPPPNKTKPLDETIK